MPPAGRARRDAAVARRARTGTAACPRSWTSPARQASDAPAGVSRSAAARASRATPPEWPVNHGLLRSASSPNPARASSRAASSRNMRRGAGSAATVAAHRSSLGARSRAAARNCCDPQRHLSCPPVPGGGASSIPSRRADPILEAKTRRASSADSATARGLPRTPPSTVHRHPRLRRLGHLCGQVAMVRPARPAACRLPDHEKVSSPGMYQYLSAVLLFDGGRDAQGARISVC
jgi:hypothetical protein